MPDDIGLKVRIFGDKEFLRFLATRSQAVERASRIFIKRALYTVERLSKTRYFRGRDVPGPKQPRNPTRTLRVITGTLRRSIGQPTHSGIKHFEDFYGEIGTRVVYGPVHEFGFEGAVQVPAHTRMQTHVFGRSVPPFPVHVRAHTRFMRIPARPFLWPALQDYLQSADYREHLVKLHEQITKE